MENTDKTRKLSDFGIAFAMEYHAYMKAHNITQVQIAEVLDRTQPYISKAIKLKRPIDVDDVDALAQLSGTTGRSLMIELARLTKETLRQQSETASVASQLEKVIGKKIQVEKAAYRDENKQAESGRENMD